MIRRLLCTTAIVLAGVVAAPAIADDTTDTSVTEAGAVDMDARRAAMNDSMTIWESRVSDYEAEGGTVDDAFSESWSDVEAAWANVESASADTWDDAVATFDAAMAGLEESWNDMTDESGS